jgi:arylsulfatase A-like enzyme
MTRLAAWLLPAALAASDAVPTNLVLIVADDLGYGDVACFGGGASILTPRLDRMAAEGMRLTAFYAAPVCSPARASLITGAYGVRNRVGTLTSKSRFIPDTRHTIADVMHDRGYRTHHFGKWHCGLEHLIPAYGYDDSLGWRKIDQKSPSSPAQRWVMIGGNGKAAPGELRAGYGSVDDVLTDEVLATIDRDAGKPFFIHLNFHQPHVPQEAPARWKGKTGLGKPLRGGGGNGSTYGDTIAALDERVGRILDRCAQPDLAGRTLVLFLSDNGATDMGSNVPLSGNKGSIQEGGVRVPAIAWWPGTVPAGSACDRITGVVDLLPTAAALCGGKLPGYPIDGINVLPLLREPTAAGGRSIHLYQPFYHDAGPQALRDEPYKVTIKGALYDLVADPGETTDLAAKEPARRDALLAQLKQADRQLRAAWWPLPEEPTPAGTQGSATAAEE